MDGRDVVGAGGARWNAFRLLIAAACALALAVGCSSDAASICERLDECNLLPADYSVARCENDVSRDLPDEQQADCSACLERKSCEEAVAECRTTCAPK